MLQTFTNTSNPPLLSTWEKIFISSFGKKFRMEWKARFLNCRNEKECKCYKRKRRKLLYRIILLLRRKSLKNVQSNLFILIYNKPMHFSTYDSFNRKLLSSMLFSDAVFQMLFKAVITLVWVLIFNWFIQISFICCVFHHLVQPFTTHGILR